MKIFCLLILLMGVLSGRGQGQDLLLKNARVIDTGKERIGDLCDILIKKGKIEAIGQKSGKNFSGEIHDLKGAYVLPGLIDAHVHISNDPKEQRPDRVRHLEYFLQHGITTVRDAAGDARILKELQQAVRQGEIQGPDIYFAAFVAGAPYYKDNDREKSMVVGLDTTFAPWLQCIHPGDDLSEAMKAAVECGATGIKIYGGFKREELFPLIWAARQEGLKIWGHAALFPAKPIDVAEAGMEVISHAYLLEWEGVQDTLSDDFFKNHELYYPKIDHDKLDLSRFIEAVKKQGNIFDPTLYLCMVNGMEWSAKLVKQAHQAGVKICAGTDYISDLSRDYPFLFDEIGLYVGTCGFTPWEAIRSATIIAAEVMGIEHEVGSVEKGKKANLLIVSDNPLENIEHLKSIRMVVKNGKVVRE